MTPLSIAMMGRVGPRAPAAPPSTNLLKWWKLNTGLTQSGGFASAWADQIAGTSLAQATGSSQPAVQASGALLFDGSDDYLKTATFTLNQPRTMFLRMKQVSFPGSGNDRYFTDGFTGDTNIIAQRISAGSPNIVAYAGAISSPCADLAVNTYATVCVVFNGASSVLQVDANTAITGNFGAGNAAGLTVAARENGQVGLFSNIEVKEILIYNAALDATARADVRAYMSTIP